ncbi:MAG TPA: hypothetical protein VK433_08430 [Stellaceae bacterium]|nr:hypothetical protein [Stellaceae bacterium]
MSDARWSHEIAAEETARRFSLMPILASLLSARRSFTYLIVAIWMGGLWVYLHALTNNDVAWALVVAEKWLAGAQLYQDVIEVNPPLFIWLKAPVVLTSQWTGIPASQLVVLYFFASIAVSLGLIWKTTEIGFDRTNLLGRGLTLASAIILIVFPARDFGQREHIMLIFALPYMLLVARRALGLEIRHGLATTIGLLAGLGCALKPPFFIVLPFMLEFYLVLRRPSLRTALRPELVAAGAVFVGYGILVMCLTPDYLIRVVPWILLVYSEGYGTSPWAIMLCWQSIAIVALLGTHLCLRSRQAYPIVTDVLLICACAFFITYVMQAKGWSYHILPATALIFLAVVVMAVSDPLRRGMHGVLPTVGVFALGAMTSLPLAMGTYRNPSLKTLVPIVHQNAAGGSIYTLSSYLWMSFPLVNETGVRWASRFSTLWLLPGAERRLATPEASSDLALRSMLQAAESYTLAAVVEDFERDPPKVVIVDARRDPRYSDSVFDYLQYLSADDRFVAIWSHYRKIRSVAFDDLGTLDIYVRAPEAAAAAPQP